MSYSPGTVVYAKLKGYPWWPARVEVESSLPLHVRSKKPKTPKPTIGVRFFGSKDYGWFGSNDLKPFDKKDAEVILQKLKSKKREKNKLFERSIREALDPSSSSFDEPVDEEADDDDDEITDSDVGLEEDSKKSSESYENEDEVEGEYTKKSKNRSKGIKKSKKTTTLKSSKSLSGGKLKKRFRSYSSEDEDDDVIHGEKGGKRRRASEDKVFKRKQRKIDYTDDEEEQMDLDDGKERRQKERSEGSKSPVKFDNESPGGDADDKDENKYNKDESKSSRTESRSSKSRQSKKKSETAGDKLLHLRHRLQRMTLKESKEPDNELDIERIDEVFCEVENFPITIPLLKESKIGKLMRKIAEKNIDPDPKRIIARSNELIRKWKCLLEAPTHEGSDEETLPKIGNQVGSDSPYNKTTNQPLSDEHEADSKKDEENVDSNSVKDKERLPSSMDIDEIGDILQENDEEKQIAENKSRPSLAANNQEVNNREKDDFNSKTSEF